MKKIQLRLENEFVFDFFLVGISCHLKDYRFVWFLNRVLQSNFVKKKEFFLDNNKFNFSQFEFLMELSTAYIFSNRCAKGYLVKRKQQVDYWLKLEKTDRERLNKWMKKIRNIPQVLVAYEEEAKKVKEQFIF